jgi:hypothetical protein
MSLEVAYVANKATHVFAGNGPAYDLNQVPYGPGTAIVTAAGVAPNFTATTPSDQRRPFYNKFNVKGVLCCSDGIMGNYFGNDASANYNSLQVKVEKRFSRGLQFLSTYTFSHANNFTNDNGFLYSVNARGSYGPDDMNRNHVWITNVVWDLPFGRGKTFAGGASRALDLVIGGWQISNTMNWSGGLPWTATAGDCGQINDTGPCLPGMSGSFHVGAGSLDPNTHSVTYFTPVPALAYPVAALTLGTNTCTLARPTSGPFSLPACGTTGNVGRNTFRGPHYFGDDMSLAKNFRVTERVTMQFRTDAFNVFNHPVLGFSSQDYGATGGTCIDCGGNNGTIRDIENGTTMRELQFALKLMF